MSKPKCTLDFNYQIIKKYRPIDICPTCNKELLKGVKGEKECFICNPIF